MASLAQQLAAQHDVQQTTGQGDAVFSWDRERTACFPDDAKPFEKEMHGAFTEDVETGVVYTGIPGYGLCAISPVIREVFEITNLDRVFVIHEDGVEEDLHRFRRQLEFEDEDAAWKDH